MSIFRLCVMLLTTSLMSACQTIEVIPSDNKVVDATTTSIKEPKYEEFVTAYPIGRRRKW